MAGVAVMQSGTPFSILDTSGAAFYGTANSRASWASGATVASAQGSGRTQNRLNGYFNTAAFVRAGNDFGNAGRNILRGPNQRNLDLSINKRFAVTERVSVEWRSEFFNVLNIAILESRGQHYGGELRANPQHHRQSPRDSVCAKAGFLGGRPIG